MFRSFSHIPGLPPRVVAGAVSPMDILPTFADLAGANLEGLAIEGQSLIGGIFHGAEKLDRVVFAETNWPKPLRAAVTQSYKLVHDLKANLYQLYDLKRDPWEKKNQWQSGRKAPAKKMKKYLDEWLERVYFARNFEANQLTGYHLRDTLLKKRPSPKTPSSAELLDGSVKLLGYEIIKAPTQGGGKLEVDVYLEVIKRPVADYRIGLELARAKKPVTRGRAKQPGPAGFPLPTTRWRKGDFIRDRLSLMVPREAESQDAPLSFVFSGAGSRKRDGGIDERRAALGLVALKAPASPDKAPLPIKPRKQP